MTFATNQPVFLARVERKEHAFIRACQPHVDGLVLAGRLTAPPWSMDQHPIPGLADPDLVEAARTARVPFLIDPDTWPLTEATSRDDRRVGRSVRLATARDVPLPLVPGHFDLPDSIQAYVRASLADQAHAIMPAAPYFRFTSREDPWLQVNLECLRFLTKIRGKRPLAAFVLASFDALTDGTLEVIAPRYAAVLPPASLVFISVADLHPDTAAPRVLAQYLRAVDAFSRVGLAPIADRVGEFGPAAIAFGARGASRGTRIYRHTPPQATFSNDWNPKMRLKWLVPGSGLRLEVTRASERRRKGTIAACPESEICTTLTAAVASVAVRLHDAHLHRQELREAARRGAARQSMSWREQGYARLTRWAQAVEDAAALSAEA